MAGSSRSVVKALNAAFDDPTALPETHTAITAYLDKHNTLRAIHQSSSNLHHEFVRLHTTHVEHASSTQSECLFLSLLTQCIPVFDRDQVDYWMRCYLRPAIDSAGYDSVLVERTRDLVRKVTAQTSTDIEGESETSDPELTAQRKNIARHVVAKIIDVYLGDFAYVALPFTDGEKDSHSQAYFERIRFIQRNCRMVIQEYAMRHAQSYFELINDYFEHPKLRLPVLTLLASYLATQLSQTYHIMSTKLFGSLVRCMAEDENDAVLVCSMSVLCMLIPQISDRMGKYLVDMLYVYVRVVLWPELRTSSAMNNGDNNNNIINGTGLKGSSANDDVKDTATQLNSNDALSSAYDVDTLHLATLLYGLFPFNMCSFARNPKSFLRSRKPAILHSVHLPYMAHFLDDSSDPRETPWEDIVAENTSSLLQSFYLHPKFLQLVHLGANGANLDEELQNPISWLIHDGNDLLGPEEISLRTLNLNPNIFLSIPSGVTETPLPPRPYDTSSIGSYENALLGFVYHGTGTDPLSGPRSRHSSLTMPVNSLGVKQSLGHQYWGVSGIKNSGGGGLRNVSSQASYTLSNERANSGHEIRFKDVAFDTPRGSNDLMLSPPGSVDETQTHFDSPHVEAIDELLASHERLYTSRSPPPEENAYVTSPASGKRASSLLLHEGRSVSIPTTSLESAVVQKKSIGNLSILSVNDVSQQALPTTATTTATAGAASGSVSGITAGISATNSGGTIGENTPNISGVVDFYQRELLLMRNELEFANYMKLLNKFNFIKLKLTHNKVMREVCMRADSGSVSSITNRNDLNEKGVVEDYRKLTLEIEAMQSGSEQQLRKLTDKLVEIQSENDVLKASNDKHTLENEALSKDLEYLSKQVVANKDIQLAQYKLYIEKLKDKVEQLHTEKSAEVEVEERPQVQGPDSLAFIFDLKSRIVRLEENNASLAKDLNKLRNFHESTVKMYETKLQHEKDDMGENVNGYVNQFEKRIKELNSVVMKYEALLDEKNARILHLSTSKPISIPEGGSYNRPQPPDFPSENSVLAPEKNESFSSSDSVHSPPMAYRDPKSPVLPPHPTPLAHGHHSSASIPVLKQFSGSYTVQPIVRGRGGYQKRSKSKLM